MATIHVKQKVKMLLSGDIEVSMSAVFDSDKPDSHITAALEALQAGGQLPGTIRHDEDIDTFFVKVESADRRDDPQVDTIALLIRRKINAVETGLARAALNPAVHSPQD